MKTIVNPARSEWANILKRPTQTLQDIESTVNEIFEDIARHGDDAIKKYTAIFDGVQLEDCKVTETEIALAEQTVSKDLKQAIQQAKNNIETFHASQKTVSNKIETMPGIVCWSEKRAIERIGLYIPGGSAPLFSTVLMLAVPAKLVGCKSIVLCTPPNSKGQIASEILYAAKLCGVNTIYKIGGIQAIAAMTFGTQTIQKVYKIFGPGNQFVTVAKQMATKFGIAIDMPAGPSELLVLADDSGNVEYVAADLLSQAEHGSDSQVLLVTTSKSFSENVQVEVQKQLQELPRKAIAEKAIANSLTIIVKTNQEALDLINEYGPEHLILATQDNPYFIAGIQNAGSVFIGNYSPESAGDYASGTNHTLPTNGYSKAFSGVNLDSFTKNITFQELTREGLKSIGQTVELMAEAEGLQAHKNAVSIRLKEL